MRRWSEPSQMEPLLPPLAAELVAGASEVLKRGAVLGANLHPITRSGLARLLRHMNSYYSNLIEGHHTRPADIERALRSEYATDGKTHALQLLHRAHIETQILLEQRLSDEPDLEVADVSFLLWIHRELYQRTPRELRWVDDGKGPQREVLPGALRQEDVEVGAHIAPTHTALPRFLTRFREGYAARTPTTVDAIIAAGAAHHRLTWIHPFLDGNGRVARLFSHAQLMRVGVASHGLWSLARGMARNQEAYRQALANADAQRQSDYDGRGNLSARGLSAFCLFFLDLCLDQIAFVESLLDIDGLQHRVMAYVEKLAALKWVRAEAGLLLRDVLLRGEIPRGESGRIMGIPQRTARDVTRTLLERGLLYANTPKGPFRLGFPIEAVGYYFPRLYPEGAEDG